MQQHGTSIPGMPNEKTTSTKTSETTWTEIVQNGKTITPAADENKRTVKIQGHGNDEHTQDTHITPTKEKCKGAQEKEETQ
jgi:hypothetical protein